VRLAGQDTLAAALELGPRELVALVGGGGKTGALQRLVQELAAAGGVVVATTTTAMFLRELAAAGPVVFGPAAELVAGPSWPPPPGRPAALALRTGTGGKVVGLPSADVDDVWAGDVLDYLIVEADGSRGRPLKAFAGHEPQLPASVTTIVQVAGVDACGSALDEEHVHRAGVLAGALGLAPGSEVTPDVMAAALTLQIGRLRELSMARIVTLLNKADRPTDEQTALAVAQRLHGRTVGGPDRIVVSSLRERRVAVARERPA
jgi:probable selenium-dependent hydroxylase accessory protein YqeC